MKRVRQAREAAHVHPHREVLPFDVADVEMCLRIRVARNRRGLHADHLRRAVAVHRLPWRGKPYIFSSIA